MKTNVPVATDHFSTHDCSCDHYTTLDFFQTQPTYINELIKGSYFHIKSNMISRLAPMFKPTFGRVDVYNRLFFVPMRLIFPKWDAFYQDTAEFAVTPQQVTHITGQTLISLFTTSGYYFATRTGASAEKYDFVTNFDGQQYWLFSDIGRYAYKVLQSLGYQIIFAGLKDNGQYKSETEPLSALPLFAYAKVMYDYYQPSQYPNNTLPTLIEKYRDAGQMSVADLYSLLIFSLNAGSNRKSDFFVDAWDNPVGPNSPSSTYLINDLTTASVDKEGGNGISNGTSAWPFNTPFVDSKSVGNYSRFSQFTLDTLKALSDFLKRKQIAGYKAIDRYLVQFGDKLSSQKMNISFYCGESKQRLSVADVMSMSDTEGASLGDYSGRGFILPNEKSLSCNNNEFGFVILVTSCVPHSPMVGGRKPFLFHGVDNRLSFYQPEFDALGAQPIRKDVVYSDDPEGRYSGEELKPNGIFGFSPRYAEYKTGFSTMSGDFTVKTLRNGLETFQMARRVEDQGGGLPNYLVHGQNTIRGDIGFADRFFYTSHCDHIYSFYEFEISISAPNSALYDNYHFEQDGKDVKLQVGGSRLV